MIWCLKKKSQMICMIIRKMFYDAIGKMIEKTMELHDYKFDNKIYRQMKGGAIGMDLTGVIADI